jgi:hypothetical protein
MRQEEQDEQAFNPKSTSVGHSFDELARGLASGTVSRRGALKLVGGALLGGVLASIPGLGWAQGRQCPQGEHPCPDGTCVPTGELCPTPGPTPRGGCGIITCSLEPPAPCNPASPTCFCNPTIERAPGGLGDTGPGTCTETSLFCFSNLPGRDTVCTSSSQCPAGSVCSCDGQCRPTCGNRCPCSSLAECAGGLVCSGGLCVPCTSDAQCNDEFNSGNVCCNGLCNVGPTCP